MLNGKIIRQSEWPDHPANALPEGDKVFMPWTYARVFTARHNPLDSPDVRDPAAWRYDTTMAEWLRGVGLSDVAVALAHGINTRYGRDAQDVSALTMLSRAAFSITQRKQTPPGIVGFTARDGVQRIPEAMAAALPREVRSNTIVAAIDDTGTKSEIRCTSGAVLHADRVVCALPFSVLRRIAITPALTGPQAEAVATLPSQAMTQLYFDCASNSGKPTATVRACSWLPRRHGGRSAARGKP